MCFCFSVCVTVPLCLCLCLGLCQCLCLCLCQCRSLCLCASVCVCASVCACACVSIGPCASVPVSVFGPVSGPISVSVSVPLWPYLCLRLCLCLHVLVLVPVGIWVCASVCVCVVLLEVYWIVLYKQTTMLFFLCLSDRCSRKANCSTDEGVWKSYFFLLCFSNFFSIFFLSALHVSRNTGQAKLQVSHFSGNPNRPSWWRGQSGSKYNWQRTLSVAFLSVSDFA